MAPKRRGETALAAAERRTHEILESISDVFLALDHEFRFTFLNSKAEEWGGKARKELLGRVIWEAFPALVGTETQAAYRRAARERRVIELEALGVVRRRWVSITIYPGDAGLAVYFRDIDARKRDEMALRDNEARLRFATESAGIGTWDLDIATGRIHRSDSHAVIFGVDPSVPWSHAAFLRQVLPEDRALADRVRGEALAAGREWCITCRIRRASDGAVRWVEARGAPAPEVSGNVRRYVGIVTDVTERKEAEASRERMAETLERMVAERTRALAHANARLTETIAEQKRAEGALLRSQRLETVGQLVGGVAHAFNNLLTTVTGNLDLLGLAALPDDTRRYLDRALQAACRAGALTHQLLAYAGRQGFQPRPLDANAVLVGLQESLRLVMGRGVRIETDCAPGLWRAVGEPDQLTAVVLGVARNAREAMPAGGRLLIASRNVPAGDTALPTDLERDDYVMLSIRDDGHGMAPDVLARACEPFFTTRGGTQGRGLGLAQVDGVMRQFGGTLRLRSRMGGGTTVELFLPREKGVVAEADMAANAGMAIQAEEAARIGH